jgi:hypothetical protein
VIAGVQKDQRLRCPWDNPIELRIVRVEMNIEGRCRIARKADERAELCNILLQEPVAVARMRKLFGQAMADFRCGHEIVIDRFHLAIGEAVGRPIRR